MKDRITKVAAGGELHPDEVAHVAGELLAPEIPDEDKADFLAALHKRGERPSEIAAFAEAFLARAVPFDVPENIGPVLDVCGTGGDKLGLFNVSTTVMFVAAGAGAKLVKHGNRGITSKSGGADVLEALGVPIEAPEPVLKAMLSEAGATFLFAPRFHPAFKAVAPARKLLAGRGQASIFNMLGPLLNPARPHFQLAGVFREELVGLYAEVLPKLGRRAVCIVHGRTDAGAVVDEISTLGPTLIAEVDAGGTRFSTRQADDWGITTGVLDDLRGGNAAENARKILAILEGRERGAPRDLVLVNAAAAIKVAGLATDWQQAMARAAESVDSGAALASLEAMRKISAAA